MENRDKAYVLILSDLLKQNIDSFEKGEAPVEAVLGCAKAVSKLLAAFASETVNPDEKETKLR